jgi:dolichyl-phosphate-mannose--protein O-mannosyl transferase
MSLACKWTAIAPILGCLGIIIFGCFFKERGSFFKKALFIFTTPLVLVYLLISVAVLKNMKHPSYAPSISSSASYGFLDALKLQSAMLKSNLSVKGVPADLNSPWWSWPLPKTPIWFTAKTTRVDGGQDYFQGIVYLGNPAIAWPGFACMIFCTLLLIKNKNKEFALPLILYFFIWALGAALSLRTQYYFYYFGSEMLLPIFIVGFFSYLMHQYGEKQIRKFIYLYVAACILVFCFNYPLLTDQPVLTKSFRYHIWLPSWAYFIKDNSGLQ